MKELSIEEKAKRYDEAIERAKGLIDFCSDSELKTLENVFPELSESEDEKIRKELIKGFNNLDKRAVWYNGITYGQILAWLEKQGEQKPKTEYIYLKFREGDTIQKITGDKDIVTIAEVDTEAEEYRLTNSGFIPFKYEYLWYLVEQKPIPIFRVGETIIAKDGTNIIKEPFHIDKIEDDYYWDGENTILVCNQDDWELVEQKTTEWSEEDEYNYEIVMYCLNNQCVGAKDKENAMSWFKFLKDRVQPKQEWGEEDDRNLSIAIQYVFQRGYLSTVNWLKSLKERYTWKPNEHHLKSLQAAIDIIGEQTLTGTDLKELLEQLNKL